MEYWLAAGIFLLVVTYAAVSGKALRLDQQATASTDGLYERACERLRWRDAAGARDLLVEALAADPLNPSILATLAETRTLLGHDELAARTARQALELLGDVQQETRDLVEGRAHATEHAWREAVASFGSLFEARRDVDHGLWLTDALTRKGDLAQALEIVEQLRRLASSPDPRVELAAAAVYLDLGDAEASLAAAERAWQLGREAGEEPLVAHALIHQALAFGELGSGTEDEVVAAAEGAEAIFERTGERRGVAKARSLIAWTCYLRGDLQRARTLDQQALDDYQDLGDRHGAAGVLMDLGTVAVTQGRFEQAGAFYHHSLELYRRLGEPYYMATATMNIGATFFYRGDLEAAAEHYRQALRWHQEIGSQEGIAQARINLAEVHAERGELGEARALHEHLLTYHRQLDDRFMVAHNQAMLGKIFAAEGDVFVARDSYQEAAATQARLGDRLTGARTQLALAELVLSQGDPVTAERLALDAEEILLREDAIDEAGLAGVVLARALLEQGKLTAARAVAAQARQVARGSDNPRLALAAAIAGALLGAETGGDRGAARTELLDIARRATAAGHAHLARDARQAADRIHRRTFDS